MRRYSSRWRPWKRAGERVPEQVRAAQLGSALLACEGLTILGTSWLLPPGSDVATLAAVALVLLASGALAPLLPWWRWPLRATLGLPLLQLAILAVGGPMAAGELRSYGGFTLLFVFVGLTQRPWTSLFLLPPAAAAYVAVNFGTGWVVRLLIAVPLWLTVGELLARTQARQRQAEQSMRQLLDVTRRLAATTDEEETVRLASGLAAELLQADAIDLMVAEHPGSSRFINVGEHNSRLPLGKVVIDVAGEVSGLSSAIGQGRPLFVADTASSPLVSPALARASGSRSAAFIPLPGEGGYLGVIAAIWRYPRQRLDGFATQAVELLSTEVGRALERVRASAELSLEAETDALTGLANRRTLTRALARLKPGDAVVALDLDHFKQVNDGYGHAVGDQVLIRFGECMRLAAPRRGDCVARYGGEEFTLVLVGAAAAGARAVLERLQNEWLITDPLTSFSAGVAVHRSGEQAAETVARADAALYRAKQTGRARWVDEEATTGEAGETGPRLNPRLRG
jgi:diguanylate cyclase (GGDEF)-like protein